MADVTIEAGLQVDDGAGGGRSLSIDDFKAAATGAASASKQDAAKTVLDSILAAVADLDPNTDGLEALLTAIRDAVQAPSVERTNFTYDDFAGDTLMTGYTENGVVWTIARNTDGTIASVTSA